MNPVKHLPLIAFIAMTAFTMKAQAQSSMTQTQVPVATTAQAAHVKSYREWKHELVLDAQNRVTIIKTQIETRKALRTAAMGVDPNMARTRGLEAVASRDLALEKLEKDLREEQYDLDVANDLTVTDYFVGYLTKVQNKKAAFQEVAGKLSPEEVAELMTAYANSVFGAHAADLPASAANISKEPGK
ncbi:hypothetical protein [Bdellovibrio sp. NC01]|uniref:hypothetical protein n=1 Tax=Bdellovibrio sp. NC01 TaxID=2220073 RepID=UPI001157F8CA|nr:hypothetical protein [Bdellovibrio sp. NC01]QDK36186.1 hypothetical protein DOE51_00495 [Bdellovibrio sp. NC01]